MEEDLKTVFVIGIIVFIIYSLFLTYASLPDRVAIKSIDCQERPDEETHSLYADGVIVL
jgi:hypothetical protein